MYENTIQVGVDFEAQIFGSAVSNWQPSKQIDGPEDFGRVVREFLCQNHSPSPDSEEVQIISHYVQKYLARSLKLEVENFVIKSARGTALDRAFGVDGLLFARINGIGCVVSIDAYAANRVEIENLRRESLSYGELQSRIYQLKLNKQLIRSLASERRKKHAASLMQIGRPHNYFLLTPYDIRRPRGLKEFSRNVAISLWQQAFKERELRFCPISDSSSYFSVLFARQSNEIAG